MKLRSTKVILSLLFLNAITIAWLLQINTHLTTPITPRGITSFHVLTNKSDADSAKFAWEHKKYTHHKTAISYAIKSFAIDSFMFIPFYSLLVFALLIRFNKRTKLKFTRWYYPWLLVVAVLADITENLISYFFLIGSLQWTPLFIWASLVKISFFVFAVFSIRLVSVVATKWLAQFSKYIKILFETIWNFRVIVIELVVLYIALWQSDQGQDLLINLNQSRLGFTIFFFTITFLAFLNWHLPKYLSYKSTFLTLPRPRTIVEWLRVIFFDSPTYHNQATKADEVRFVEDSDLGRLFGTLTFLIPAFGMLNVMEKYKIGTYHPLWILLGLIVFIMAILQFNLIDNAYKNYPKYRNAFHIAFLCCVVALIYFLVQNDGRPKDLILVFASLVTLASMFLIFTSIRRYLPNSIAKIKIAPWVMCPAVVFSALFIAANICPLFLAQTEDESIQYSTISIFVFALFAYLLFFSLLIFWGRSTKINIAGFFLLISLITAIFVNNRFHDVDLQPELAKKPVTLKDYTKGWLLAREKNIENYKLTMKRNYPVVIVSNYGGGIRAAAWTSLVITDLDIQVSRESQNAETFQDHVFAYTGASGGTIGASVMCALRSQTKATSSGNPTVSVESMMSFYKSDFLSPVVIGLIGRDFIFSVFGINGKDRSRLQEEIWEYHMQTHFQNKVYGSSLSSCWQTNDYKTPLLFANSTQVEEGLKGIVAPVSIDSTDFPAAIRINKLLDHELKLSTAAFLSARFPFISPAGRIRNRQTVRHFLDGGIFENSGAETAAEIAAVFKKVLAEYPALEKDVDIVMVSLKNSPPRAPEIKEKNLFELSAPLNALVSNVDGAAIAADKKNEINFEANYFKLYPDSIPAKSDALQAVLPLGWQLSEEALSRLKNSLDSPRRDSLLTRFRKK